MDTAPGEFRGAGAAVAGGEHTVGIAVQRDRRHRNRRQRYEAALQFGITGVARREAEAVAVAVNYDIDEAGSVVGRSGAVERGVVEIPVRRPVLPENSGDLAPIGGEPGTATVDLEIILVPEFHLV